MSELCDIDAQTLPDRHRSEWRSYQALSPMNLCCDNRVSKCCTKGRSGAVDRASDFGPRGPWFDSPPVHISLWP